MQCAHFVSFPSKALKVWRGNLSWSYVTKLNNWLTIWFTPYLSKTWHIFISSKWLHQICPVFNFVRKNMLGGCTAHTGGCREPKALYLCLDGSGRSVLLGTDSVLWSLAPLCIPPVPLTYTLPPSLLGLCSVMCMCVYVCICMHVWNYARVLCTPVYMFFELQLRYFLLWISHKRGRQQQCFISIFHRLFYLYFFQKRLLAPLIKHEKFLRKWFWNWN